MLKKFLIFIFGFLFIISNANAQVNLSIQNKDIPKTKILLHGFNSGIFQLNSDISIILKQIESNLATTNLFTTINNNEKLETEIDSSEFSQEDIAKISSMLSENQTLTIEAKPNFAKYYKAQIDAILVAHFSYDENFNLEVKIRLWDVADERQLFGKYYAVSKDNYKKIANIISNEVFVAITGEKSGHFDSKIVYVSEYGNPLKRTKRISLINFDGSERKFLTSDKNLALTPIFTKKEGEIMFLNYSNNTAQMYSLNIHTSNLEKVGGFKGTTFAASIHPKNADLILISSINEQGNSDIYEINIARNYAKRLTSHPAIDTTPYYSPDGKKIIFSSDRDRGQQLYVMDSEDGGRIKRITSAPGSYSKPVWSPDGKLIAFTKQQNNNFYIGVMSPDGRNERLITTGYFVEGARWSPNGRYLVYSKRISAYGKQSLPRLYMTDILTGYEREIPTPANEGAVDPDWISNS